MKKIEPIKDGFITLNQAIFILSIAMLLLSYLITRIITMLFVLNKNILEASRAIYILHSIGVIFTILILIASIWVINAYRCECLSADKKSIKTN
ncbi:hypothetical protein [Metamycoplasma cloacale]|uniref:hypothetical protein n=1 Tax=Metamycoplasma cloacale TaxID=92401 RepID=UPI00101C739E|nr:hypothetical protein [Metamycoplasma cloacale]